MSTVSSSFTAVSAGTPFFARHADSFTFSVSGTFVGTVVLEKSNNGGQTWESVHSKAASASGTILHEQSDQGSSLYRYRCTAFTSGTIVTALADAAQTLQEIRDASGLLVASFTEDGFVTRKLTVTETATFGAELNSAKGADIASATTTNLDSATGNVVDVTGTTTITGITLSVGRTRIVRFTGALLLTHGASLVLPGAANITTAAGDYAIFAGYASGVVRCVSFIPLRGVMATLADTETLTNKTLTSPTITLLDSNLTIQDNGDPTKQAKFEASGITAGQTRTLTIPDESITIVGTAATQTLSNKTLTAPVLNNPTLVASAGQKTRYIGYQPATLTAGTSTTPAATSVYVSQIFIPANCTLTGVAISNGATVGTDKYIVALFDSAGAAVANSALAGVTTAGADVYQAVDFTAPVAVTGPKVYWIALYVDGTTDRFRSIPAVGAFAGLAGEVADQIFGTIAALTLPTTFTADKGPVAYTY